jgi:midasin
MLLAGRCRNPEECKVVQEVLEIHFKRKLDPEILYTSTSSLSTKPLSDNDILGQAMGRTLDGFGHVVWTKSMKRLAVLVGRALQFNEPVLLVGETG